MVGSDSKGREHGGVIRKGLELIGANVLGVALILGASLDFHLDYHTGDRGWIEFAFRCQPPFTKTSGMSSDPQTHSGPEGGWEALVGRHGATNPAGRVRCNM